MNQKTSRLIRKSISPVVDSNNRQQVTEFKSANRAARRAYNALTPKQRAKYKQDLA